MTVSPPVGELSAAALPALRALGDRRTEEPLRFLFFGAAAGDDVEPAALEVIADAYRQVSRP